MSTPHTLGSGAASSAMNSTAHPQGVIADPQGPAVQPVDRRSRLTLREFRHEYLYPGKPVVICDATEGWRARIEWTFDYFASKYGGFPVKVYRYDTQKQFTADDVTQIPLAEYVHHIAAEDWSTYPYYLRDNWTILFDNKELMTAYEIPKYFFDWYGLLPRFLRMPYPRLFLGPKGAITPLHSDVWDTHAWLSQLVGRKRWLLFSPDQKNFLYEYKVRVEKPDFERHPLYKNTNALEAILSPGDTIFVPSRWSHWVVSLDATISLTGNYMGPGCFRSCLTNTFKDLLFKRIPARFAGQG